MLVVSFDIGIVNLGTCVMDGDKVVVWKVIKLFEKMKKNVSINTIADTVYTSMDQLREDITEELGEEKTIDLVLLENQPSRINGVMKTIQMILYGYFQNLKYYERSVKDIIQVNPTIKLKGIPMDRTCSKAEQYKNNKKKSIELCIGMIGECEILNGMLEEYKAKKDDMCDAMCQIVGYLRNKNIVDITSVHR